MQNAKYRMLVKSPGGGMQEREVVHVADCSMYCPGFRVQDSCRMRDAGDVGM